MENFIGIPAKVGDTVIGTVTDVREDEDGLCVQIEFNDSPFAKQVQGRLSQTQLMFDFGPLDLEMGKWK